jgi:vacuolar-type H+-ATPase subunit H
MQQFSQGALQKIFAAEEEGRRIVENARAQARSMKKDLQSQVEAATADYENELREYVKLCLTMS